LVIPLLLKNCKNNKRFTIKFEKEAITVIKFTWTGRAVVQVIGPWPVPIETLV
jgi:hypothetical protein